MVTIIDNYDTSKKQRVLRKKGAQEALDVFKDIHTIDNMVKDLPLVSRLFHGRQLKRQYGHCFEDDPLRLLILPYILEHNNKAYEETLKFNKNKGWLKYIFERDIVNYDNQIKYKNMKEGGETPFDYWCPT